MENMMNVEILLSCIIILVGLVGALVWLNWKEIDSISKLDTQKVKREPELRAKRKVIGKSKYNKKWK